LAAVRKGGLALLPSFFFPLLLFSWEASYTVSPAGNLLSFLDQDNFVECACSSFLWKFSYYLRKNFHGDLLELLPSEVPTTFPAFFSLKISSFFLPPCQANGYTRMNPFPQAPTSRHFGIPFFVSALPFHAAPSCFHSLSEGEVVS